MEAPNDTTGFAASALPGDSLTTIKSSTFTALIAGAVLILYLAYWAILPKPIPGIPYNRNAAWSPLGDIPEMIRFVFKEKQVFSWMGSLTERHKSPIVQIFVKPFQKPWVVVSDPFETQDILLRRGKEIDRSLIISEMLGGLLPEQHMQFQSDDPRFKRNRNLINHLMAPSFVNRVSGPETYRGVNLLIQLWKAKCERAQGRPFRADHDLSHSALDAISAAIITLPESETITRNRLEAVKQIPVPVAGKDNVSPNDVNTPITFPEGAMPPFLGAVITMTTSLMLTQVSPLPTLTYKIAKMLPTLKNAIATKEAYLTSKINESLVLLDSRNPSRNAGDGESIPQNAVHAVLRERHLAAKEGHEPNYHSRHTLDEFVGLLVAGHDTTAVAMAWGVKYLADHPTVQDRLRSELRKAMPVAFAERRAPTYEEIVALQQGEGRCEYLEAVIEEVLRVGLVIDFLLRETLRDTEILGRMVPKGTAVCLVGNGPGYLKPASAINVDETMRSPGARRDTGGKMLSGSWDDGDLGEFKPERWLKMNPDTGREEVDPLAGPTLAFGLGPRGCYGKRLGMMALRIHFVMILWWFKLGKCPEELSGYEGMQKFAREPRSCYVRLEDLEAM
ncbi:cytochrome P450 [Sordaria brevicollis]|uniref:Cytochrome P450 n=1 Tax=Sordaria brevicollis TaxID=83679 RepID=A0AAE0PBL3_SORBR|nr:cytochrome P450 [Sordaria brevicollis]